MVNAIKIQKLPSKDFIQAIQQSGITQKVFDFEKYPTKLDTLFKYTPEGKTVSRKTVTNKSKTDSVLSLNRQWERLKRQLKIAAWKSLKFALKREIVALFVAKLKLHASSKKNIIVKIATSSGLKKHLVSDANNSNVFTLMVNFVLNAKN